MLFLNNDESSDRIDTIKNFIKNNYNNISFLWNQIHYINTTNEFNQIVGQLILEYCKDEKWCPLTYTTPNNEIYCYLINESNEIKEFISSDQYVDSLIQKTISEASENDFNNLDNHHFGKTREQLIQSIIPQEDREDHFTPRYNTNRYIINKYTTKKYRLKPTFMYKYYQTANVTSKPFDFVVDSHEKTDEDDEFEDKSINDCSDYDEDYYEDDGKTKKR